MGKSRQRLNEAAEAFEGAFLKILLKSMRSTIPEGGLFERKQMEQFEEMRDGALADSLANRGATGIAQMVVRQLGGEPASPTLTSQQRGTSFSTAMPAGPTASRSTPTKTPLSEQQSRKNFVQQLLPAARKAASLLGIEAKVLIAQAALETGWGKHIPASTTAASSHNHFGVKAGANWDGPVTEHTTNEFLGGKMRKVVASFRAYGSAEESVADYVKLISQSARYGDAIKSSNSGDYLRALQNGGYATDPHYADKVQSVMGSQELRFLND